MPDKFQPIIGLEVHIELKTQSKMFCSCKAEHFGAKPNTQTCPVCLGLPGSLPVPNKKAVEWTILAGLALNCQIEPLSKFDRKNYFYPDLPKGYQISQYDLPLARTGNWPCVAKGYAGGAKLETGKLLRIRRVHLEEDTGKLIHENDFSLIDFNRSGVPLMEIVTEPDFSSAQEVKMFLQKLQQLVRYLGVAEADMEKGQMRCEPNVNLKISKEGKNYFTPISEIKNVNSFRFVEKAIDFEIERQFAEFQKFGIQMESGNKATRGWDEKRQMTVLQREKEEAEDYRYFPEPDIPPIRFTQSQISNLKSQIPELPERKLTRFISDYGLTQAQGEILSETRPKADYFEQACEIAVKQGLEAREIANLLINKRIDSGKLTPIEFVKEAAQMKQAPIMPEKQLRETIQEVLITNQVAVEDFQKGKTAALEFLVGQVSRQTQGKADPNLARKLLLETLAKEF